MAEVRRRARYIKPSEQRRIAAEKARRKHAKKMARSQR